MTIYSYIYAILLSAVFTQMLFSIRQRKWEQVSGYVVGFLWCMYALYISMMWNA